MHGAIEPPEGDGSQHNTKMVINTILKPCNIKYIYIYKYDIQYTDIVYAHYRH